MGCGDFFWWFRFRGTVIVAVWWQVLLIAAYTAGIVALSKYVPELTMNFPQTLMGILGTVVSLLLAFRANSAYDRYWEGRKLWTGITQDVRRMTRAIWIGVKDTGSKSQVEKISALNLVVAYAISLKHYLRDEYSYDYDDLKDLIKHLPRFSTPSSNIPLETQLAVRKRKAPITSTRRMAYDTATPTNIPVEISYYLRTYVQYVTDNQLTDSWALGVMQNTLGDMVDKLADFERILRTPIPLAYSIHLNHSVWLYLLSLPYQLVASVGWFTIPVVALGSFCMLGINSIGWEIENPFGYDTNDLPLDDFCQVMKREIEMVIGNKILSAEEWIFSEYNNPIPKGKAASLSARQLAGKTPEDITSILSRIAEQSYGMDKGRTDDPKGATSIFLASKGYQSIA